MSVIYSPPGQKNQSSRDIVTLTKEVPGVVIIGFPDIHFNGTEFFSCSLGYSHHVEDFLCYDMMMLSVGRLPGTKAP